MSSSFWYVENILSNWWRIQGKQRVLTVILFPFPTLLSCIRWGLEPTNQFKVYLFGLYFCNKLCCYISKLFLQLMYRHLSRVKVMIKILFLPPPPFSLSPNEAWGRKALWLLQLNQEETIYKNVILTTYMKIEFPF